MTPERDPFDAVEDLLQNMELELVLKTVRDRVPAVEPRIRAVLDRLREFP